MVEKPTSGKEQRRTLDLALSNARQNIALLKSQARANRMDAQYFSERLTSLENLLTDVVNERTSAGNPQQLAALYEVSRLIGSSLDLQTVLDQVMDAIIKLTEAERGFLMLLDDDGNLIPHVARNIDQKSLDSGAFHVSRTITRQVVNSGEPVVTTNAQSDPRFAGQESIVTNALRSIMATPLRVRGTVIGVVYVDNHGFTGMFKKEDLDAFSTFAGQAAVAIDNARLFAETDEALQARVEELSMLRRMDRELNEAIGDDKVVEVTLQWAYRMTEASGAALGLIEGADDQQQLRIVCCEGGEHLPNGVETDATIAMHEHAAITWVLNDPDPHTHKEAVTGRTLLYIPIYHENQPIGLIILVADHDFSEEQQDLVTRMAARASVAIQNTRLFEAVKAADKAKSEFVSVVAHELKVPMTSISGYADLLKMAGPVNDQQAKFVEKVKNNVTRMKILVTDLSDISRIESGNLRIDFAETDPRKVVELARDGAQTQITDRGHHYVEEIADGIPTVRADENRLTQILLNLLSNAYKYTPDGGTITLKVWEVDKNVTFSVQDTGVGMSAEEVAKLGTKFWRADNDHSINQPGTGLGFTITRNLIALMGGELTISSEPGKGSTFSFTIPAMRPPDDKLPE